jgi:wyosine [tRNA(Phe)-imidazoG37] synthetase (radical SAM superfamily)
MYTYGPVPSRRLGRSLGVSPIPAKSCSYSCVYCQLGRTTRLLTERRSFFPRDEILAEIVKRGRVTSPDYVTFVGDGEPTLCADLGWLIEESRRQLDISTAVITNGSLLWSTDVREDLLRADVVVPSLDAGNERTFKRINRAHQDIRFDSVRQGLIDFSREYDGQLWLEVMLVEGINDTEEELMSIKHAVDQVQPHRTYITTPIRPPAETWVRPPDYRAVLRAQEIIGESITITDLEAGDFGLSELKSASEAIIEIGGRHPLRLDQAERIESDFSEIGTIARMIANKTIARVEYHNVVYLVPNRPVRKGTEYTDRTGNDKGTPGGACA